MKIVITKHNLGLWAASYICQKWQHAAKKPFVLGLPTGGTVEDMYAALSGLVKNGKMSFRDIVSFNMDEYVGLPPTHDQSYHYYMHHHLFGNVDALPENVHILNGQAADLAAECKQYEENIVKAGGIDLFLGGVGRNGHVAFNEPGSSFESRTREVKLTEDTRQANSRFFGNDPEKVPTSALSVGIGTVLSARELLFLASGASKAEAVAQLAHGEVTTQWPITALKTHANATLLIDPQAAGRLGDKVQAELKALWQNNPEQDFVITL